MIRVCRNVGDGLSICGFHSLIFLFGTEFKHRLKSQWHQLDLSRYVQLNICINATRKGSQTGYIALMHFSSKQANISKLKKKKIKIQYYFYPSKPSGQMLYRPSSLAECNL